MSLRSETARSGMRGRRRRTRCSGLGLRRSFDQWERQLRLYLDSGDRRSGKRGGRLLCVASIQPPHDRGEPEHDEWKNNSEEKWTHQRLRSSRMPNISKTKLPARTAPYQYPAWIFPSKSATNARELRIDAGIVGSWKTGSSRPKTRINTLASRAYSPSISCRDFGSLTAWTLVELYLTSNTAGLS